MQARSRYTEHIPGGPPAFRRATGPSAGTPLGGAHGRSGAPGRSGAFRADEREGAAA